MSSGEWFLHLVMIAVSAAIIYLSMISLLQVKRTPDAEHPSTFFSLDQIMSRTWFRSISFFFGGSAALLYAAIAFQGGTLVGAIKKALASYAGGHDMAELFAAIPPWLDPVFILGVFLFFFLGRIRGPLLLYRDVIINGAGFYAMVDEQARETARTFIHSNHGYEGAAGKLEDSYQEAPLPEALTGERNDKRLAYQLIWHVLADIRAIGPTKAFAQSRAKLGLSVDTREPEHVDVTLMLAAGVIFFVLMGVYVIVVPTLGSFLTRHGLEWPDPTAAGWSYLVISVLKSTLAFAFPLLLAINMFPLRRRNYAGRESAAASFAIVAAMQWASAFVVLELFNLMDVSFAYYHSQYDYTFAMARLHVGAFLYALCPVVAFFAWIKLRPRVAALWTAAAIMCVIVGCSFFLCDVIYECYSGFTFFFWHQALLGLFMTFAFFVAASMTSALEERQGAGVALPAA